MKNKYYDNPIIMTYLAYIVTFGSALFVLPLILLKFSSIEISIWFLFTTILGLASLADSGFGGTLVRATSYFYSGAKQIPKNILEFKKQEGNGNSEINISGIQKLIQSANILYLGISLLASLLIFIIGYFIVKNLISMTQNQNELWAAFFLLTLVIFIRMQTVKWNSFLHGFNKVATQKKIETIIGLIRIFLYTTVLLLNFNILELVLIDLFLGLITLYVTKYNVKILLVDNEVKNIDLFKYDKNIMNSIFPSAWRLGAIGWGSYLINYGSSLIVSQLSDPNVIASFLVTQRIIFFARQIAQVPLYAELPKIFQMMAKKNFTMLKQFASKAIFIGLIVLIFILAIVGAYGNDILGVLNIKTIIVPINVFIIMAISIVLEYHHSVHAQIYMGSNHVPFLLPALLSGILIIILAQYVVGTYGLVGIVLIQFLIQLSLNNWYPVYLNLKLLDWKFIDYWKDICLNVPKTILMSKKNPSSWIYIFLLNVYI